MQKDFNRPFSGASPFKIPIEEQKKSKELSRDRLISQSRRQRIGADLYVDKSPYKMKTNFFEDSLFNKHRQAKKSKSRSRLHSKKPKSKIIF